MKYRAKKLSRSESDEILSLMGDMNIEDAFRLLWLFGYVLQIVPKKARSHV